MTVTWIRECSLNHGFLSKHQEAVSTKVYVIVRHLRHMRTMSNFWRTIVRPYAYFLTPAVYYCKCCNLIGSLLVMYSLNREETKQSFPWRIFLKWLPARVFQCFCAIHYV